MSQLLDIETTLIRDGRLASAACLVVAVSGGPDSLALLHRLTALATPYGWRLHVAHLDHGLRGEQSAAEAAFVAEIAADWGLTATIELRDVDHVAKQYHVGLPAAARATRYRFLAEVALQQQADAVVLGHQSDDQAETVLLHVLRGTGPSGLSAMRPRTEWVGWRVTAGMPHQAVGPALIRPMLNITRDEIEAYCDEQQLEPRRDPTNNSLEYTRGRIRHQLLPLLGEYNAKVVSALARTARLAAIETDYMQSELDRQWQHLIEFEPGAITFHREQWNQMHPALQRHAIRRAVYLLRPERDELTSSQLDHALSAMNSLQLFCQMPHNLVLHRKPHGWTMTVATTMQPTNDEPQLSIDEWPLNQQGMTPLPDERWRVIMELMPSRPEYNLSRWQGLLDADAIQGKLMLRQRRPGDRMRPAGGIGSRRIQDIMVDMRLPRELRAQWPLFVDDLGILWIPGLLMAEHAHPTPETTNFLLITLEDTHADAS
ncbi:tRNA lysidine(34) synthetase TilS [Herpetosiphon gulosus]|uniref:tRNA(Ile)-lysidine synthase n=1 Tax=Herpetosiphon gulosus TaxID=1973496 RepID=A0ABP9X7D2_9CHLR